MLRQLSRPVPLVLALAIFSFIPVLTAVIDVVQFPASSYPKDAAHLAVAPVSWFLHALTGVAFGIAGPMNFFLALRRRFGRLHRVTGRVFAVSGLFLGLTAFSLLLSVEPQRTPVVDITRAVFGLALILAIGKAIVAIRRRDIQSHRAWVIRAFAFGMGLGTVALMFFPIYLVTGAPPKGLASDILFAVSWSLNVSIAELIIRRTALSPSRTTA